MKSQITLMMIMGIMILLAAGVLFYLGTVKEKKPEPETQQISKLAINPVKDYITTCLDLTAREAVQILAKQGGVLYQTQGGTIPDTPNYVDYENLKLHYNIVPPIGDVSNFFFSTIPKYPFVTFPYLGNNISSFGYYGISQLNPLYKSSPESIQEMLESYVSNKIPECTDWSTFEVSGLEIMEGTPNTSLIFAENLTQIAVEQYINFKLNWPVRVFQPATSTTALIDEFAVNYPVKLSSFYLFIEALINNEVTDISFEQNATERFSVITEDSKFNHDDLITVKDMGSMILGEPLEWRIARKNRAPALWHIDNSKITGHACAFKTKFTVDGSKLKAAPAIEGFPLQLNASDPDDDMLTYSYEPTKFNWQTALNRKELKLKVKVSDGELHDYHEIKLKVTICEE